METGFAESHLLRQRGRNLCSSWLYSAAFGVLRDVCAFVRGFARALERARLNGRHVVVTHRWIITCGLLVLSGMTTYSVPGYHTPFWALFVTYGLRITTV
jgi:hypothetical protein